MPKVQLMVQAGYGTGRNPATSYRTIDLGRLIMPNEHIREVTITDFEPEEDGSVRASAEHLPVIVVEHINFLVGELLTVTDATARDEAQRKAVKDLVSQTIWQWYEGQGRTDALPLRVRTVVTEALLVDQAV